MRKLLRKLRDRKGITMTEVIVAMTVVILITGAAISLLVASVQFDETYQSQTHAMNACESAAQCVRFADTQAELEGYLARLGFEKVGESQYALPNSETAVKVTVTGNVWTVTLDDDVIYESEK